MNSEKTKIGRLLLIVFLLPFAVMSQEIKTEECKQKIEVLKQQDDKIEAARLMNNLAMSYWKREKYTEAINYYEESLTLNKNIGNTNAIRIISNNLGMLHSDIGSYQNAFKYFEQALKISQKTGRKTDILTDLLNIALVLDYQNKYNRSIEKLNEAVKYAEEMEDIKQVSSCYLRLSGLYKKEGNSKKSLEYLDKYKMFDSYLHKAEIQQKDKELSSIITHTKKVENEVVKKDSALKESSVKLMHTRDSLSLIEQINREKQMKINLMEARQRNEALIRNFLIIFLSFVLIFSLLLIRTIRQKQKINTLLKKKNHEIECQHRRIQDSISYAKTIQTAMLPEIDSINRLFESFILFKPKDLVSGDFYWIKPLKTDKEKHNGYKQRALVAAVDCTGHGVPGAFMSMIGKRLLDEIVTENHIEQPDKMLEMLNTGIQTSLKQEKSGNTDGMDICLCLVEQKDETNNNQKTKITYSGAKRNLYILRKGATDVETIKGDRIGIGGLAIYNINSTFTNKKIELTSGDCIYLTTDGIVDQNKPHGKRFGTRRLIEEICKHGHLTMTEQKKLFENIIDNYKQHLPQRDDMTMIGIRL